MIQTPDELRRMVIEIVKVKPNSDPTKTQGIRLRKLLNDILDTIDDLVEKQGFSISTELENNQNLAIQNLRDDIMQLMQGIPDFSLYMLRTDMVEDLSHYVLMDSLNQILTRVLNDYQKISDAFDRNYDSLTNKPDLSVYALRGDIPVVPTYDLSIYQKKNEAFSKSYNDLTDKPSIPTGAYNDLSGKPNLGLYQLKSDVQTYDLSLYQLKSTAFNADYNSLTNKPLLFDSNYNSLTNKPTIITSYTQLTDKPTIPAAQVQSDWNATTGLGVILNKPVLFDKDYNNLTNKPLIPLNKRTFTTSGELSSQVIRDYITSVTATGSGQTIDISGAGFTTILGIQLTIESNVSTPATIPIVSIKSYTTSQLVINFLVSNTTTVSVLGASVIGLQLAVTVSNTKVHILIKGY